jgi:peroxiredoxin
MELTVGKKAPEIKLPDQDGKIHKLSDYKGQWVILYFYPTDDTSGCTKEACSMRDNLPKFEKVDAVYGELKDLIVRKRTATLDDFLLQLEIMIEHHVRIKSSVLSSQSALLSDPILLH